MISSIPAFPSGHPFFWPVSLMFSNCEDDDDCFKLDDDVTVYNVFPSVFSKRFLETVWVVTNEDFEDVVETTVIHV